MRNDIRLGLLVQCVSGVQLRPLLCCRPIVLRMPVGCDVRMNGINACQRTSVGTPRQLFNTYLEMTVQQRVALDLRLIECAIPNEDVYRAIGLATCPGVYYRPGSVTL